MTHEYIDEATVKKLFASDYEAKVSYCYYH